MFFEELMALILVVDDDQKLLKMVRRTLMYEGFEVVTAATGQEALAKMQAETPDLLVLDWMMPELDGLELLYHLRAARDEVPVLMLTARDAVEDRVEGLDRGADDYLVKPFSPSELLARIRAVFRRIRPAFTAEILSFGEVKMDLSTRKVTRSNKEILMGPTEFRILQCLLEHPTRVLSREQLLRKVWGFDTYVEPRTVDVHINRLRKALGQHGDDSDIVKTIRSA